MLTSQLQIQFQIIFDQFRMKTRTRLEYVDQFRKINTLDKMPPLRSQFLQLFEQKKQENNKFIRISKEPNLSQEQLNHNIPVLLENQQIKKYVSDSQSNVRVHFKQTNLVINAELDNYKQLSGQLSRNLEQKQYNYKFFYSSAGPPQKVAKNSTGINALSTNLHQNYEQDIESSSHAILNKGKYNFHQINKKVFEIDGPKVAEVNENKVKAIDQIFKNFENYKKLKEIRALDEFDESMKYYKYSLDQQQEQRKNQAIKKSFCFNSICVRYTEILINYLRDIGLPSRNIKKYIDIAYASRVQEQSSILRQLMQQNHLKDIKDQTNILHLLRPSELSINKKKINFFDIMNISTGRITNTNIGFCVRHEKVTRAELQKALKRLQRYHKMKRQDGKLMIDAQVQTIQSLEFQGRQEDRRNQGKSTKLQLVNSIDEVKKQWRLIQSNLKDKTNQRFNIREKQTFNQVRKRLQTLLNYLYQIIIQQMDINCPLHQLHLHLSNIQNVEDNQGFDQRKLLWYIMDSYQQIMANHKIDLTLRDMVGSKLMQDPVRTKYIGKKNQGSQKINTNKLYWNKNLAEKKCEDTAKSANQINQSDRKSKSPIKNIEKTEKKMNVLAQGRSRTPVKTKGHDLSKTPRKSLTPSNKHLNTTSNFNRTPIKPSKTPTKAKQHKNLSNKKGLK